VGQEVSDVIQATSEQLNAQQINSVADVRNLPHNIVTHSTRVQQLNRQLKDFLLENLYTHWRVMRMDLKAKRFISELFNAYAHSPIILPKSVQALVEQRGLPRTVCDYIAGMTDRFALQEYSKLFNPLERV
jgi:dGTPase